MKFVVYREKNKKVTIQKFIMDMFKTCEINVK